MILRQLSQVYVIVVSFFFKNHLFWDYSYTKPFEINKFKNLSLWSFTYTVNRISRIVTF
jgi:hypothetical protein